MNEREKKKKGKSMNITITHGKTFKKHMISSGVDHRNRTKRAGGQ